MSVESRPNTGFMSWLSNLSLGDKMREHKGDLILDGGVHAFPKGLMITNGGSIFLKNGAELVAEKLVVEQGVIELMGKSKLVANGDIITRRIRAEKESSVETKGDIVSTEGVRLIDSTLSTTGSITSPKNSHFDHIDLYNSTITVGKNLSTGIVELADKSALKIGETLTVRAGIKLDSDGSYIEAKEATQKGAPYEIKRLITNPDPSGIVPGDLRILKGQTKFFENLQVAGHLALEEGAVLVVNGALNARDGIATNFKSQISANSIKTDGNIHFHDYGFISANGDITCAGEARVYSGSALTSHNGKIDIAGDLFVAYKSFVEAKNSVTVGGKTDLAADGSLINQNGGITRTGTAPTIVQPVVSPKMSASA